MSLSAGTRIGTLDELSRADSPIHRLDARAKVITTAAFIIGVLSYPRQALSALTPLVFYPVVLVTLGRLPVGLLARKLLLALPFVLVLALFNPWYNRTPGLRLGPLIISEGWISFASILLRFGLTVGATLILVACTGMHRLGVALQQLGVPRLFVVQLLFLYRYLFVLVDQADRMRQGAAMRSAGRPLPFRAYGPMVGHLLIRSIDRAQRVCRAMLSRGFDGEVRLLYPSAFRWTDAAFTTFWLLAFGIARRWNLAEVLGRLLMGTLG